MITVCQRFAKSRSRWNFPAFPEHTFSVLRGLGQSLNKQKPLISTFAEMRGFRLWRAIGIACPYCTKFGITTSIQNSGYNSLSRLLCYTDFLKKACCANDFGQKSRYNILLSEELRTCIFAEVGITRRIFPFQFFLYNSNFAPLISRKSLEFPQ